MKILFTKPDLPTTGIAVVTAEAENKLSKSAAKLDKKIGGALTRAIKGSRFKGKNGQSLSINAPAGTRLDSVLIFGLGKATDISALEMQKFGGKVYSKTQRAKK